MLSGGLFTSKILPARSPMRSVSKGMEHEKQMERIKPISLLACCFPQLLLPVCEGVSKSEAYRAAVLKGEEISGEPDFITSPQDCLTIEHTPSGEVKVLLLQERADFEHALRALAYRCEPKEILPSVGANTISGLINWDKIRSHRQEYLAGGGLFWQQEFKRFTADKANYCDTIILLSAGPYSAVPAEAAGLPEEAWLHKSYLIRKYHELTHFVCRKQYPGQVDALLDEIVADCIGITAAFGRYDASLARMFLGLEGLQYRPGGRLEHYVKDDAFEQSVTRARELIQQMEERNLVCRCPEEIFPVMQALLSDCMR